MEEARGILKALEEALPSLAMVRLRRVSLERRHGNLEEAETLLREAMASAKDASETSFYAVKLARQLMKVQKSLSKARKVLLEAIEKDEVRAGTRPGALCHRVGYLTRYRSQPLVMARGTTKCTCHPDGARTRSEQQNFNLKERLYVSNKVKINKYIRHLYITKCIKYSKKEWL